jgi:subtilisin-like proprotein convertase family protein
MKNRLLSTCSALMLVLSAHGAISYSPANPVNATIPDGSAVGWAGTATASALLSSITAISVTLNISGGYNGDLYAYLTYGGVLVPLLNRVGVGTGDAFGYGTAGMNITLADGYTDIHTVEFPTSGGNYAPDGRKISPQSAPSAFDAAGTIDFSAYDGMNPNGTWTLFLADLSSGAQSQLVSWSLDITAVPEPVNAALGILGGVFLVVIVGRSRQVRSQLRRWRVAAVQWIDAV